MAMLNDHVFLDIFFTLLSLLTIFYLWMKWKHSYWQRRGIRSLPGHWFFGHFKDALLMRTPQAISLGDLYRQAEDKDDVLGFYVLHKPFLLLRNPELIKHVLIKDFNVFPNHHFTGATAGNKAGEMSIFSIQAPKWKYLRAQLTPIFSSAKLKSLFVLTLESGEEMREYLHNRFVDGTEIVSLDVKDTFYKYTTDVIASITFGIRANSFQIPSSTFFYNIKESFRPSILINLQYFLMFYFPTFGKYLSIWQNNIYGKHTEYFRRIFWNVMNDRKLTGTKRGDLIDSLLKIQSENKPDDTVQFDGDVLFSQTSTFVIAGRETTITTMTYALCELAKNPEIQKKVRQEIHEKIEAAGGITYEVVQEMKYLHQVIAETLRLYPPVPFIERDATEDYTFPSTNITIEKGTPVYIALYGIHSDPKYYPDPLYFDPERFNDDRKKDIKPCSYLPFGDGPRNCIAMRLGLLQSSVGLISVLRDYEVELHSSWKCTIDSKNIMTSSPKGFLLNLKKIETTKISTTS